MAALQVAHIALMLLGKQAGLVEALVLAWGRSHAGPCGLVAWRVSAPSWLTGTGPRGRRS